MKNFKRLWVIVIFLFSAFLTNAQEMETTRVDTRNIDVTVKDSNGYNHFLVFAKIMNEDKSYVAYNVEFWVNNNVGANLWDLSKITFSGKDKTVNGSYYKNNIEDPTFSDALVLYFYMEEDAMADLSKFDGKISLIKKDGTATEYKLSSPENFQKAVKEIIDK